MTGADRSDRLAVALTLTIDETAHEIPPGNVKSFSLELQSWGFSGSVEFLVADDQSLGGPDTDTLLAGFLESTLAEISLSVKAVLSGQTDQETFTALKLEGLVAEKTLVENPVRSSTGAAPILHRTYTIRFQDKAQVLWRQHYPCALYTHKSLADVFDDQKGAKVALSYDWESELEAERPQVFLGLDREQPASFHDFVAWFADTRNGVFTYDYAGQQYKLAAAKDSASTPLELVPADIASLEVVFPEVKRNQVAVLNSYAAAPTNQAITQDHAVAGVRQDVLLSTPLAAEADKRVALETARLVSRQRELKLAFLRFPTAALLPGMLVTLPAKDEWSAAGVSAGETFRVRSLQIEGAALREGGDEERGDPSAGYRLRMTVRLEQQAEPCVDLPAYTAPRYPREIEGTVVSEAGEESEETWQAYTDEQTSIDQYRIKIPLFANQIVAVPFNPGLLPGHFYFPAQKGARVLLRLGLYEAALHRFLEWRAGARMPADGEGVQLLMGKTTTNGAALQHSYDEEGKPVFRLRRVNDKDRAIVEIREGGLLIEVKEEA